MVEEPQEILKFKRELLARRYAQSTIETYVCCLGVLLGKTSLDLDKIKDYIITLKERSYHKQMVATYRNYSEFVLGKKIEFKDLPYPRKEQKVPEVFSVQEIRKLIEYPKNLKHQLIICLFYNCGLRMGELLYLKPENINRARMILEIKSAKGNKDRNVPISEKLLNLMEEYYYKYKPVQYVFNGSNSLLYTEGSINQMLKYWAKKVGINKKIHAHKLRHCYATHLHEAGVDINIIKELLGHSDVKTTEIYLKTSQAYTKNVPSLLETLTIKQ